MIVLGVYVLIISIIVFFMHWAAVWGRSNVRARLNTEILKLAAEAVGGEMGW